MPFTKDSELEYHTSTREGRPEVWIGERKYWATERDLQEMLQALRRRKKKRIETRPIPRRIHRHKDNIGKRVRYIGEDALWKGKEGTLKRFRGNYSTYPLVIPYCLIYFDEAKGIFPIPANVLEYID